MTTKWDELRSIITRMVRSLPDGALWVGYSEMEVCVHNADGTTSIRYFPSAFFAGKRLDCVYDTPEGCSSVAVAQASAEAAARKCLEENVEALGGRIVWS